MNVIHKYSTSDNQGQQMYRYFDGKEWIEKWEKNEAATRIMVESHIQELEIVRNQVLAGQLSPLAYHLQTNLFDVKLLSSYTGIAKRHIKKHLKPEKFSQLDEEILKKYAAALGVSVEELKTV